MHWLHVMAACKCNSSGFAPVSTYSWFLTISDIIHIYFKFSVFPVWIAMKNLSFSHLKITNSNKWSSKLISIMTKQFLASSTLPWQIDRSVRSEGGIGGVDSWGRGQWQWSAAWLRSDVTYGWHGHLATWRRGNMTRIWHPRMTAEQGAWHVPFSDGESPFRPSCELHFTNLIGKWAGSYL